MFSTIHLYVFALVLGAVLLTVSVVFGGHSDTDADLDVEADADLDADLDGHGGLSPADVGQQGLHTHVAHAGSPVGLFGTLLSLRFWTFFATFFGLTGVLLQGLGLLSGTATPLLVSTAVGLVTGYTTSSVIRYFARTPTGRVPSRDAYVGKTGRVLVPVTEGGLGKVRVEIGGTTVDVLARVDGDGELAAGEQALILQMDDTTALVTRDSNAPTQGSPS